MSGYSVASGGDLNGDGLTDILIGAANASKAYVVYGKSNSAVVNLGSLGSGGVTLVNGTASFGFGISVSGAGDVNGDGFADFIIGNSPLFNNSASGLLSGSGARVVFGGASIALTNGFSITGGGGVSVSGLGDVNGDGLADLAVGDPSSSKAYIVFGKTGTGNVDVANLNSASTGFQILAGQTWNSNTGYSVSGAGDINGDGLADIIVGTSGLNLGGDTTNIYVVYGKTSGTAFTLSNVDQSGTYEFSGGIKIIDNGAANTGTGVVSGSISVKAAGDINGDGFSDLLISDVPNSSSGLAKSFVVFGNARNAFGYTAVDAVGDENANVLSDNGLADKTIIAGAGNDTITATAASVLYGGAGDDVFNINGDVITALQSVLGAGGNTNQLSRIDGGSGIDTVKLSGAGLNFDFTQIASSFMTTLSDGRINSIEKIDISGSGDNTLKLTAKDVLDLSGFNVFQNNSRLQLVINGDTGDTLDLADGSGTTGWSQGTAVTLGDGISYQVWSSTTTTATLYVNTAVTVI
jgi:hypothetical protein